MHEKLYKRKLEQKSGKRRMGKNWSSRGREQDGGNPKRTDHKITGRMCTNEGVQNQEES